MARFGATLVGLAGLALVGVAVLTLASVRDHRQEVGACLQEPYTSPRVRQGFDTAPRLLEL